MVQEQQQQEQFYGSVRGMDTLSSNQGFNSSLQFSADFVIYYVWFLRFFTVYLIFYFVWSVAEYYGKTSGIKQFFKDKMGNKGGR